MAEIPEAKDVYVGELADRGEWVVANIETSMFWPIRAQKFSHRGAEIWVLPIMKHRYPGLAMKCTPRMSREDCERRVMRFLSALCWVQGTGVLVEGFTGGSSAGTLGREQERGFGICEEFDLSYLPEPAEEKALLAMALMREGRGLNHPGYGFLSLYRVLEVAIPNGRKRGEWMRANIESVRGHRAKQALEALKAKGIADIAAHLYESGRCAMAHAREEPIIDPDDPTDLRRLSSELPLMDALAELAVESHLGVETSHTVWEKHLYELAGFKEVFGPEVVGFLQRADQMEDGRPVEVPIVGVQIRRRDPYKPLARMRPIQMGQGGSQVLLALESEDKRVRFRCILNFGQERLEFDIDRDISARDDGSAEGADVLAEVTRFSMDYFGNGQLQLVNADTGALLSRKDAYIPLNRYLDHETATAEIEMWKTRARERRARDEAYGREMNYWLSTKYDIRVRFTDVIIG